MPGAKPKELMERLYRDRVDGTTEFYRLVRSRLRANDYVLDLGCGIGREETDLRSGSHFVVGCDLGDDVKLNGCVTVRSQGDAYRLPFADSTFDAVLMDYVLEHLESPGRCAREVRRVLRPGGLLFFRTPNLFHYVALIAYATPHSFHRWAISRIGKSPGEDLFETHYKVNTRNAVRRCFEGAGFVGESVRMVEKEPSYLAFARPALLLGYCYERVVNSSDLFAGLRSNIFASFKKPCGDYSDSPA
jgi:SAM-dependent methyltransferase